MSNEPDSARAQAFAGRMMGLLNDSFLGILISIGYQAKLFEVMNQLPPSTSEDIAKAAGLQERYVREWLGGMVVGRIVEYQPASKNNWQERSERHGHEPGRASRRNC